MVSGKMKRMNLIRLKLLSARQTPDLLRQTLPVLSLLGAVLLWGSSFAAMRIVLNDLDPYAVMFARLFTALICILPFAPKLVPKNYQKGDWKILLPMVLFQPCLYFLFESNALTYTTSSQAGIISACLPLMVAVGAYIFLSEILRVKTIAGLILSVIGVVFLTWFQGSSENAPNPVMGNLLEVLAMASACGNIILIRKISHRYNTWSLTGMQVLAGTLFFLPGVQNFLSAGPSIWNFKIICLLLYLGAFVSLVAFGLYNYGISRTSASKSAIFINLIPVVAILLGWVFLSETLNLKQSIAAIAVITGVFLSNKK